jgi:hypothetical protein
VHNINSSRNDGGCDYDNGDNDDNDDDDDEGDDGGDDV